MAVFTEYDNCDGLDPARLLREGHVSAPEVMEAAIARAQTRPPRLNTINLPLYDTGREMAAGPFAEVPFGNEFGLLRLASQRGRARPWAEHKPAWLAIPR